MFFCGNQTPNHSLPQAAVCVVPPWLHCLSPVKPRILYPSLYLNTLDSKQMDQFEPLVVISSVELSSSWKLGLCLSMPRLILLSQMTFFLKLEKIRDHLFSCFTFSECLCAWMEQEYLKCVCFFSLETKEKFVWVVMNGFFPLRMSLSLSPFISLNMERDLGFNSRTWPLSESTLDIFAASFSY